jgi:hypothetical protein
MGEFSTSVASPQESGSRIALVIGNSAYSASPLRNPVNDARAMAQTLEGAGFDVILGEDLNQTEMKRAMREFGGKLSNDAVGLFYYAGHGMQVGGRNYLIPIGAVINNEEEVEYEAVDVGFALAQMESARSRLNIVVLDACRDNPFARSFRSTVKGLASIDAPLGTLIAYATAPGSVASDGDGENGLYTGELIRHLREPGLKIEDVFKRVRVSVQERTGGRQVPWESSSLTGDFYFDPTVSVEGTVPGAGPGAAPSGRSRGLGASAEPFLGSWVAEVSYHPDSWFGEFTLDERFNFFVFGNTLQGSVSHRGIDLAIVEPTIEGDQLSFHSRTGALTNHYLGVVSDDEINFMMRTEGDEETYPAVYFTAERVSPEPGDPFDSVPRVRATATDNESGSARESLSGSWVAEVTYGWEWVSPTFTEHFELVPLGNTVQGTASWRGSAHPLEGGTLEGAQLTFTTQFTTTGRERRERGDAWGWAVPWGMRQLTLHYIGLVSGDEIHFMLRADGDDRTYPPLFFIAKKGSPPGG